MSRLIAFTVGIVALLTASRGHATPGADRFKQLHEELPTPSEVRLASGAPGPAYWQQRADYDIELTLDDAAQRIDARETIVYTNASPHDLDYLWVQLDQNSFRRGSDRQKLGWLPDFTEFPYRTLRTYLAREKFEGGVTLNRVAVGRKPAKYTVVGTMMRIDLEEPLRTGRKARIDIAWTHNINNAKAIRGRGGYEEFDDGHRIYTIAQWFPRMAAYNDVDGWQNKQFLGRGEFTLELGDYRVAIRVPTDHVVAATGVLQNANDVLSAVERERLDAAIKSDTPVLIVTEDEAVAASKEASKTYQTWRFEAENVRDFAFATSRRFMWDAMGVDNGDERVLCMSYYPKEAAPLWTRYSSPAIAHTIEVYGRLTFPYPYPVSISINGPVGGMEYPMVTFNGPRAEEDGTYYDKWKKGRRWARTKYGLISVIIHEVGHNWFPMIVNSDERQWTWMDEGLNTFLQFVAEQEWEEDYPSWRGPPKNIVPYMLSDNQVPIMTNSESILQFGNNAYGKPATALNILRETVMGRALFDHAFKTYATRWRFKRPMPADFFRTMEDASGVDLDWFWRGWFYSTEHVDIGLGAIKEYTMDTGDPDIDKPERKAEREAAEPTSLTKRRNEADETLGYRVNRFPELKDFYNHFDPDAVTEREREAFREMLDGLEPWERDTLATKRNFYAITFDNVGGVVMPVPLKVTYEDGTTEMIRYPAEIWARKADSTTKLLVTKQPIKGLDIDPDWEIADADRSNNHWPAKPEQSRFKLFKRKYEKNEMQLQREWEEKKAKEAADAAEGTEPGVPEPTAPKPSSPATTPQTAP